MTQSACSRGTFCLLRTSPRYIGALSNSGRKAANLTGFYKGIQSAGAAVFWRLDGLEIAYNTIFGATVCSPAASFKSDQSLIACSQWGLLGAALVFAAPIIWIKIKDTTTLEEDLKFSDETVEDVVPTTAIPHKETMV